MYVTNRVDFGHLVNADNFDASRINSEIYQIFDNRWDWEQRYIHENYTENFNPNNTIAQVSAEGSGGGGGYQMRLHYASAGLTGAARNA
jgi:hypothetical protein